MSNTHCNFCGKTNARKNRTLPTNEEEQNTLIYLEFITNEMENNINFVLRFSSSKILDRKEVKWIDLAQIMF